MNIVLTMKKPFGVLAEGLLSSNSRGEPLCTFVNEIFGLPLALTVFPQESGRHQAVDCREQVGNFQGRGHEQGSIRVNEGELFDPPGPPEKPPAATCVFSALSWCLLSLFEHHECRRV